MRPRGSHILLALDYAIGVFFALSLLVLGGGFFALGGAPKAYEWQELGGAYTDFLLKVEGSAHDLRVDYCARADVAATRAAKCADLSATP